MEPLNLSTDVSKLISHNLSTSLSSSLASAVPTTAEPLASFANVSPTALLSTVVQNVSLTFSSPLSVNETSQIGSNMTIASVDAEDWDDWKGWNLVNFASLTSLLASTAMVIGGVVPYIPQYIEIKKTQNSSGFSTFVCLALIAANTLRIIFWFGRKFETPLLIQSVVMLLAMFVMMEICLRMRSQSYSTSNPSSKKKAFHRKGRPDEQLNTDPEDDVKEDDYCINSDKGDASVLPSSMTTALANRRFKKKSFTDLNPLDFWQWTDLVSYIECTATFTVIIGLLMYLFMDVAWFVESVGYASLLTEACLAIPQLLQNYRTHSTIGMSASMVLLWAGGDLFKTGYFVIKQVPMQFIVCGIIQVTVDLMILAQVALYPSKTTSDKKKSDSSASGPSSTSGPKELKA